MMTPHRPETNHPLRSRLKERGAELVETAFVLPLLLMLLIGVFWAARAYNIYETITRAAREGARVAVAPTCATCGNSFPATTAVQTAVNNVLSSAGMNTSGGGITVNIQQHQQLGLDPNNPVAAWTIVSITYPYQFTLPFSSLNAATINISTQVQMVEEQ